jgi:hypothetical protein
LSVTTHVKDKEVDAARPQIFIEATSGWGCLKLREVWEYRELLWFMIVRDIKGSYRQMALGPLWILIQPLVSMVIFSLIFGALARLPSNGVPLPDLHLHGLAALELLCCNGRLFSGQPGQPHDLDLQSVLPAPVGADHSGVHFSTTHMPSS